MNRSVKEKDLTRIVAIYAMKHGTLLTSDFEEWKEKSVDYVRLTEPFEVKFVALSDEIVLSTRVDQIDKQIEQTRAQSTLKINDLMDQKQRLLAIAHDPISDEEA